MISMVERMSRAMWSASKPPCIWEEAPDILQSYWTGIAVAALREMREPTEVMLRAADDAIPSNAEEMALAPYPGAYVTIRAAIDAEIAVYEAER